MASINLHAVQEFCRRFWTFEAAHFILTMRKLGAIQIMQFCLLSHCYWFLVLQKMLTKTAVREYQKKISEEYNSINLNIRRANATHKRYIMKADNLWTFITLIRVLKSHGVWRQERKCPTSTESVQNKNERKEQYSH